jgi:small-conductance mechanosensitive channel/flagellar motility protein MotE (MotC chaperone)
MSPALPPRFARLRAITPLLLLFAAATALPADAPSTTRPEDVLSFLNQTIVWYRQLGSLQQLVNEPSDAVFLNDNRQIADQVVRLSFDFARTEEQLLSGQKTEAQAETEKANSSDYQNLLNAEEKSNQQISQEEQELESLKQQLSKATGKKRTTLESAIAESQDELELLKARHDTIENILQYVSGVTALGASKGLRKQIEELARTVPAVSAETGKQPAGATPPATSAPTQVAMATSADRKTESSGIFGLLAEVFEFRRKVQLLDGCVRLTDSLAESSKKLRGPLVGRLREFTQRSDELAAQPQSQDAAALEQQRKELQGLTAQYKQLSATILPLGKQNILLEVYRRNIANWENVVQGQYSDRLKGLLLRLGILAGVILLILAVSDIWRRFTFRYIQDSRRRHQFLILRRIIVIPLIIVVIVVAFANGLGSVTLFAGLSTAGLAVALQNLIQSVVGYFVLIGKYGVRVGDRVQVAGVTGDVIDIGLARLHLVEVSSGPGSRPTGRVVAFSNAVVFQPDSGFFKQIPGTNFVWHEVSLTLGRDSDYRQVEERMLQAVNRIFGDYQEKMESQRSSMERAVQGLSVEPLHPESRLNLTPTGTQVVVRYPVEVGDSAEIDDRIAREVLDATGREPKVAEASSDATANSPSEAASKGS